jgi:hypothetical protein
MVSEGSAEGAGVLVALRVSRARWSKEDLHRKSVRRARYKLAIRPLRASIFQRSALQEMVLVPCHACRTRLSRHGCRANHPSQRALTWPRCFVLCRCIDWVDWRTQQNIFKAS